MIMSKPSKEFINPKTLIAPAAAVYSHVAKVNRGTIVYISGQVPSDASGKIIGEGDYVVVEAKGDNITRTGVRYDNDYCMVWRLENGKVKEIREYCDSALVEKALGPFPASKIPAAV